MAQVTQTPLMKQYEEIKKKHPDAILLFRVGDFYEIFKDDAKAVSEICGVTLTTRANGNGEKTYLAGFPHHALDKYLPMLTKAGKRVAICEQIEDPKLSKKTVRRDEPKATKQSKPKQTKIYGMSDIEFDKLDPDNIIASFRVRIPEDCKCMGKCVNKNEYREMANHVYIQPSTGKLLATDTYVVAKADIECKGKWPEDEEKIKHDTSVTKRYIAPISADAVSKYAGQEIDVVTYRQDGKATTIITSDTAVEAVSSVQINASTNYPNWQRVWVSDEQCVEKIRLTEESLKKLRKWIVYGKGINVEINISRHADNVQFSLWREDRGEYDRDRECYAGEPVEDKDVLYCDILDQPSHDIHAAFGANHFRINIMDGFNGELWFAGPGRPIKFCGEQRESILMPRRCLREKFSE